MKKVPCPLEIYEVWPYSWVELNSLQGYYNKPVIQTFMSILVDWLVGWLVGWLVSWLIVGRMVGWLDAWMVIYFNHTLLIF